MLNFLLCVLVVVGIVMLIPYLYFAFKDFVLEAYLAMLEDIKELKKR